MPSTRYIETQDGNTIEFYVFPGEDLDQITRIASVGLSSCTFADGNACCNELLLVVPFDVAEDQGDAISTYLSNVVAHVLGTLARNIEEQDVMPNAEAVPAGWPSAVLFDDPRAEPAEVVQFHAGMQAIQLHWVIPIFAEECALIQSDGIDAFDDAVDLMSVSLVEPRRGSCA